MARRRKKARPPRKLSRAVSESKSHEIYLGNFSVARLKLARQLSKDSDKFHLQFYFNLALQRQLNYQALLDSLCSNVQHSFEITNWCRIVDYQYTNDPLSTKGSIKFTGGRFNYGYDINDDDPNLFTPFNALYIAEDENTARMERFRVNTDISTNELSIEELALRPNGYTTVFVDGQLNNYFDLTHTKHLNDFVEIVSDFKVDQAVKELGKKMVKLFNNLKGSVYDNPSLLKSATSIRDSFMKKDWEIYPSQHNIPSNSQIFGKLLNDAGIDGLIFTSVRSGGKNIVIFPKNIVNGNSHVSLSGELPEATINHRMDNETWEAFI